MEFHDRTLTLTNALLFSAMKRREKDLRWKQKEIFLSTAWFFICSYTLLFILFDDSFVPDYFPSGPSFSLVRSHSLSISFSIQFSDNSDNFFFFLFFFGCSLYEKEGKKLIICCSEWGNFLIFSKTPFFCLRSIYNFFFFSLVSWIKTKEIRNW